MGTFYIELQGGLEKLFIRTEAPDEATVWHWVDQNCRPLCKRVVTEAYYFEIQRYREPTSKIINPRKPIKLG